MSDLIDRQAAIDAVSKALKGVFVEYKDVAEKIIGNVSTAQPERLTDDDFETIRIHLNAYKEKLCNQHRWKEAEEYQRIIDRFIAFASAQPKTCAYWDRESNICALHRPSAQPEQRWISCGERLPEHGGRYLISVLDGINRRTTVAPYLPRCKAWAMNGRMAYWKVIAWMPLPKPYKEERKDNE